MGGNLSAQATAQYLGTTAFVQQWVVDQWSTTAATTPHPGVPRSACAGRDMAQKMTRGSGRAGSPTT